MNENFYNYAKERLETMTPGDIKEAADRVGLALVSIHSGKMLSEVPYAEIWVGMELVSAIGNPGKVTRKIDAKQGEDDNWIAVDWATNWHSEDFHFNFCKVKVK